MVPSLLALDVQRLLYPSVIVLLLSLLLLLLLLLSVRRKCFFLGWLLAYQLLTFCHMQKNALSVFSQWQGFLRVNKDDKSKISNPGSWREDSNLKLFWGRVPYERLSEKDENFLYSLYIHFELAKGFVKVDFERFLSPN